MLISKNIIKKIIDDPKVFGAILIKMNSGGGKCKADTLARRLQRYSVVIQNSAVIIDHFREMGVSDEEIFEVQEEFNEIK